MSRYTRLSVFLFLGISLLPGCKKEDHSGHDHGPGEHGQKIESHEGHDHGPDAAGKPSDDHDDHEGHDHGPVNAGPKHAFEWGGVYFFPQGDVRLVLQPGPDDPSIAIAFLPVEGSGSPAMEKALPEADAVFKQEARDAVSGAELAVGPHLYKLRLDRTQMVFTVRSPREGHYALFTEHFPSEFATKLVGPSGDIESSADVEFRLSQVKLTPEAVRDSGIRVSRVGLTTPERMMVVPARVSFNPEAMAHVGSPLRGRAVEVMAKLGDKVNTGDVLLVVDSPELGEAQLDLFQKRVAEVAAQPHVELAQSAHDRAKKLYDENRGISLTELQKREGELKTAQSALTTAKAAVTSAANRLLLLGMDAQAIDELARGQQVRPSLAIRAPIAGRVVQREVTLGELVGPDREALLVLADTSSLWVLAEVPETRLSEVALDAPAAITLASLNHQVFHGKVVYIAASLNPVTRTATVRLEVADEKQALRAGMFAQAQITLGPPGDAPPVLAVPEQAIQTIEGKPVVFVAADEPNTFVKRSVKVGPVVGRMVPILDGLKEGEPIVVSGSFILKADLGKAGAAHEH